MTAAEFGRLLAGPVKRRGAWFDALCPVPSHGDTRPSLSFRDGDRGVIVKCRAGCQPAEIAHAVGHTVADLFFDGNGQSPPRERVTLAAFAAAKALPVNFLRARGVEEDGDGLRITYRLRDGSLAPRQRRRWALAAKEGSAWEGPTGISPVAYGLWQLDAVMEKGELLLVEGETDALAAWYHNVPCLGLPGSDTAKLLTLDALEGIACLYIIQEPDRGGETFVAGIAARLTTLGWTGQAFVVRLPTKDLHELHVQAGVAFADQLQAAQAAGERLPLTSAPGVPASTEPGAPTLPTRTWREMTARPPAPPVYHWPPWVPAAALAFLVGAGESLKSWLALGIAVATAAGRTVFADDSAEATIAAGPVLYLTAENSLEEEQRRCGLLKIGLRLPDELPLTFVAAHSLSLASEAEYRAVVGLVEQLHPVAILVDSAIAVAGLSDENDNARVRTFLKSRIVPLARAYQATVYVIAHAPKPPVKPGLKLTDEHAARGASDWRNAADVMLSLRREPALGPAAVMLRATKVRIGCRPTPLWFFLDERDGGIRLVRGGEYSDETATAGGPAPKVREAVLAALDALQRAGEAGLQLKILLDTLREAGVSPATARRAVDLLRGRTSWEYGPHQGQAHAVVREGKTGRKVTLVLSAHGVDLFEGDEHSIFEADEDPEP